MQLIQRMRNLLTKLAFKILDFNNVKYYLPPSDDVQETVNSLVDSVEKKWGKESGEFKRHQVLRAASNVIPNVKEREVALAIELAVRTNV